MFATAMGGQETFNEAIFLRRIDASQRAYVGEDRASCMDLPHRILAFPAQRIESIEVRRIGIVPARHLDGQRARGEEQEERGGGQGKGGREMAEKQNSDLRRESTFFAFFDVIQDVLDLLVERVQIADLGDE